MKKHSTLSGFRDLLPAQAELKEQAISILQKNFKLFGYLPIETPHLEYAEVLLDQNSEETVKQVYKFQDNGGRDVALRFDHTMPLARYLSNYRNEIPMPFKRYVIGNVFRGESPQAGRYREFTQCDFDFIGTTSLSADAEIIKLCVDSIDKLGIGPVKVMINNRQILDQLSKKLGGSPEFELILTITDKLEKIGEDMAHKLLCSDAKLSVDDASYWLKMVTQKISSASELCSLMINEFKDKEAASRLSLEVTQLDELLHSFGLTSKNYSWDLKIARGLQYYTGFVFETILLDNPKIGSVCSGGRYDQLTQRFGSLSLPAVGASIGLDRLLSVASSALEAKIIEQPKIMLAILDAEALSLAIKLAMTLHQSNITTFIYPTSAKLGKQFDFAAKINYTYLLALGKSELAQNFESTPLTLANLKTGDKHSIIGMANLIEQILNGK